MRTLVSIASVLVVVSFAHAPAAAQPGAQPGPAPGPRSGPQDPPPPPPPPEPDGTKEVMGTGAAVGILGGFTLVDQRDVGDPGVATMIVLGSAAGGAGMGYALATRLHMSRGDGYLTMVGMSIGLANGAFLLAPAGVDGRENVLGFVTTSAAVGTGIGIAGSQLLDFSAGQVVTGMTVSGAGLGTILFGAAMIDPELDIGENSGMVAAAVTLDAVIAGGLAAGKYLDWSESRARAVGLMTYGGAALGSGLGAAGVQRGDSRTPYLAGMLGMWGGFALGALITSDDDAPAPAGPQLGFTPVVTGEQVGFSVTGGF